LLVGHAKELPAIIVIDKITRVLVVLPNGIGRVENDISYRIRVFVKVIDRYNDVSSIAECENFRLYVFADLKNVFGLIGKHVNLPFIFNN
jgi:hypothetical protein